MLSEAISAQMKLVDFALNYRRFTSAQITAAANPLVGRLFPWLSGRDCDLQDSSFGINAGSNNESAQGELAGSNLQQIGIGVFTKGGGQKAEANEHQECPRCDDPVGCLRRHDSQSFRRTRKPQLPWVTGSRLHAEHRRLLAETPDD
jgi:hypothetical protein